MNSRRVQPVAIAVWGLALLAGVTVNALIVGLMLNAGIAAAAPAGLQAHVGTRVLSRGTRWWVDLNNQANFADFVDTDLVPIV
jgi:hypothetical protein